jgi:ubiquinone/menaquinone biosynthesis C-methylase UbiE
MTQGSLFDKVAELYDAIRPHYPEALFARLVRVAGLKSNAQLLEIATGTGQATLSLAKRGYRITGVELGEEMARIARNSLRAYPSVHIVNASFEEAQLPQMAFDLVYVATAFHWISAEAKFAKSHALLKPSGHLAIIHRLHVSDERGDAFTAATQPIYQRYERDAAARTKVYVPRPRAELRPEPIDEELFTTVAFDTFPEAVTFSAQDYVSLLSTYSPTLAMSPGERATFLDEIHRMIDEKFGGRVLLHYAVTLQVAQRK